MKDGDTESDTKFPRRKGIKRQAKLSCGRKLRAHNGRWPPFGTYSAPLAPAHFRAAFFFSLFSFGKCYAGFGKAD